jgi:hypothetical protein
MLPMCTSNDAAQASRGFVRNRTVKPRRQEFRCMVGEKPYASPGDRSIFNWRAELQRSSLPALTKLVCLNLSLYMKEAQGSCSPSTREQMRDTGLSFKALAQHLHIARTAGYLASVRAVSWDNGCTAIIYSPTLPGSLTGYKWTKPDIPPALFL